MPTNLELKARTDNQSIAAVLQRLKARDLGLVKQTDTYFVFRPGRLKLREMNSSRSELIWYQRPNSHHRRYSNFKRIPVKDPQSLKNILASSIGVKAVVKKKRRVYLFKNARIHIDAVENLGTFIEFEVMVTKGRVQAQDLLSFLRRAFNIKSRSILVTSYCDLINRLRKKPK